MHALETDEVLALARRVRALVAGRADRHRRPHRGRVSRAVSRRPTSTPSCWTTASGRCRGIVRRARTRRQPLGDVPGLALRDRQRRASCGPPANPDASTLDDVPLPARRHVAPLAPAVCLPGAPSGLAGRDGARLSVPLLVLLDLAAARAHRCASGRSTRSVEDFAAVGDHVFVADDLFWYHPSRSLALAQELRRRGIRKQWILVQSRVDLVARHADLLEAWRPIARDFDIFFGLEAATNEGLTGLMKDATVDQTAAGHRRRAVARLRRHRQLRDRSGVGARRTSSGCGRSSSGTGCSRPASRS